MPQKKNTARARARRRYRFKPRPTFMLALAVLVLIGGFFGVKALVDNGKVSGASARFIQLLNEGQVDAAREYLDTEVANMGALHERTVRQITSHLDAKVEAFSALARKDIDKEDAALSQVPADLAALDRFPDLVTPKVKTELQGAVQQYISEQLPYEQMARFIANYRLLPFAGELCDEFSAQAAAYYESRDHYEKGMAASDSGDYATAVEELALVIPEDAAYYGKAQEVQAVNLEKLLPSAMAESEKLYQAGDYEGAYALVERAAAFFPNDTALQNRVNDYKNALEQYEESLVSYSGPVEHVFTHCLIAYPEICYSSPEMMKSLDTDCLTPKEFTKIIQSLYDKGYILIDINSLVGKSEEQDGKIYVSDLKLPKGKKPLVLSVDDVVYDARKAGTGMVDKLILDSEGNIATYTKHADGTEEVRYDNEVFPIIDAFVKEHPDFSFKGAKGTLFLTGFQGILGYRTQHDSPLDREAEIEAVKPVIARLKETGWNFGSHSYGHGHMEQKYDLEKMKDDTQKWHDEVESLVGETQVFAYPYGEKVTYGSEKWQVLYDDGFRIFCGVGPKPYLKLEKNGDALFQDRRPFDGYSLRNSRERNLDLFDANEVIDSVRPATAP